MHKNKKRELHRSMWKSDAKHIPRYQLVQSSSGHHRASKSVSTGLNLLEDPADPKGAVGKTKCHAASVSCSNCNYGAQTPERANDDGKNCETGDVGDNNGSGSGRDVGGGGEGTAGGDFKLAGDENDEDENGKDEDQENEEDIDNYGENDEGDEKDNGVANIDGDDDKIMTTAAEKWVSGGGINHPLRHLFDGGHKIIGAGVLGELSSDDHTASEVSSSVFLSSKGSFDLDDVDGSNANRMLENPDTPDSDTTSESEWATAPSSILSEECGSDRHQIDNGFEDGEWNNTETAVSTDVPGEILIVDEQENELEISVENNVVRYQHHCLGPFRSLSREEGLCDMGEYQPAGQSIENGDNTCYLFTKGMPSENVAVDYLKSVTKYKPNNVGITRSDTFNCGRLLKSESFPDPVMDDSEVESKRCSLNKQCVNEVSGLCKRSYKPKTSVMKVTQSTRFPGVQLSEKVKASCKQKSIQKERENVWTSRWKSGPISTHVTHSRFVGSRSKLDTAYLTTSDYPASYCYRRIILNKTSDETIIHSLSRKSKSMEHRINLTEQRDYNAPDGVHSTTNTNKSRNVDCSHFNRFRHGMECLHSKDPYVTKNKNFTIRDIPPQTAKQLSTPMMSETPKPTIRK